jgi:Uma2 family endonuclease
VLLVEVTSNSTDEYDRGEKLTHYRSLASVLEILIVSHRHPAIDVHRREPSGQWTTTTALAGDSVQLASTGAVLSVDQVYRDRLED